MDMNRRSVLVGLGTAAAGSGAVFGSGAFSSVEAGRTINVDVNNDGSGYVTITGNGDIIEDESGSGELVIDLGDPSGGDSEALNDGAITFEDNLIGVTNQHPGSNGIVVSLATGSLTTGSDITAVSGTDYGGTEGSEEVSTNVSGEAEVTFSLSADGTSGSLQSGNGLTLPSQGDTAQIDVSVDTTTSGTDTEDLIIIAQEDNTS